MDELRAKVVGRRRIALTTSLEESDRLLRTAWALRGTDALVPKGVYRFRTFEEADAWMSQMMAKTFARRVQGKLDLTELIARIPEDSKPEEVDWGPPVGGEVW